MSRNYLLITSVCILFCFLQSCESKKKTVVSATFHSGHIGGGGYIIGLLQDPQQTEVLFAQSDVGGVFKSIDGGRSWNACNNGLGYGRDHATRTIVMDYAHPDTLYRACGELRAHDFWGHIYKTIDGGANWSLLTDQIDFFGNGSTRMCGPMLAIHPQKSNVIVAAGYSKGIWVSFNGGESWEYKGLKGKRISFIRFNPHNESQLFIGTMPDHELLGANGDRGEWMKEYLKGLMDFERGLTAELIVSDDLCDSFTTLYETDKAGFVDIAVVDNGRVILLATSRGILRSSDSGSTFHFVDDKQLPYGGYYQTVSVSPVDGTVYTAQKYGETACPIYQSTDNGETWRLYAPDVKPENMKEFPGHLSQPTQLGASISYIMPDCKSADVLYFTNFWGVTKTYDWGKNFTGHNFNGLEMTCIERVEVQHSVPGKVILSIVDHGPLVSTDYGEHFEPIKFNEGPSRAFVSSDRNPDVLMWSAGRLRHNKGTPVYCSMDGGDTAEVVFHKSGQSFVSALMEDKHKIGRFWLLNEGTLNDPNEGAGIYRSDDWGKTWNVVSNPYPKDWKSIPFQKEFIERDHSTIIPYQFRNGTGSNRHFACDAQKKDVIYLGEWTEGLWRTDDAGVSWISVSDGLPFKEDQGNVLSTVYSHPVNAGQVYAGFWRAGLYRSDDFGNNWEKVYPHDDSPFNAVSVAIDEDVMVVACAESVHSSVPCQLLISFDKGKTWDDIYDKHMGSLNFINVDLDATKQRIYAATNGNGVYYIDYEVVHY